LCKVTKKNKTKTISTIRVLVGKFPLWRQGLNLFQIRLGKKKRKKSLGPERGKTRKKKKRNCKT